MYITHSLTYITHIHHSHTSLTHSLTPAPVQPSSQETTAHTHTAPLHYYSISSIMNNTTTVSADTVTERVSEGVTEPPPCLPCCLVDDHCDAVPFLHALWKTKRIQFDHLALLHVDSHPDLVVPACR
jgi:hypothetical protein